MRRLTARVVERKAGTRPAPIVAVGQALRVNKTETSRRIVERAAKDSKADPAPTLIGHDPSKQAVPVRNAPQAAGAAVHTITSRPVGQSGARLLHGERAPFTAEAGRDHIHYRRVTAFDKMLVAIPQVLARTGP